MEVINDNSCGWVNDLSPRNKIQTLSSNQDSAISQFDTFIKQNLFAKQLFPTLGMLLFFYILCILYCCFVVLFCFVSLFHFLFCFFILYWEYFIFATV